MSIYATQWNIQVSVMVPATKPTREFVIGHPWLHEIEHRWVEVYAQAVPAHIGHPSNYPDGDPYGEFLPPVVDEYDPEKDLETDYPARAVVILDEHHDEKDGQRYVDPLLVMTGVEYKSLTFCELLGRIEEALQKRFDESATVVTRRLDNVRGTCVNRCAIVHVALDPAKIPWVNDGNQPE